MEKSVRITGKVNIKLVLSNIHLYSDTLPWNLLDNNYTKLIFETMAIKIRMVQWVNLKRTVLWISDNLFSGIVYHSTQMNVQLVATYEDGSPFNFQEIHLSVLTLWTLQEEKARILKENMPTMTKWIRQIGMSEKIRFFQNLNLSTTIWTW